MGATMLRLHNTLTRTVESVRPLVPGAVAMYSCTTALRIAVLRSSSMLALDATEC